MNTLKDRLLQARQRKNLTQEELAIKSGVSQVTIQQLESGRNKSSRKIADIANALSVSTDWLAKGITQTRSPMAVNFNFGPDKADLELGPNIKGRLPLISWVQAGHWTEIIEQFDPLEADDWIPCPISHSDTSFALRVRGASMDPVFKEGDLIFVDPAREAINGSYVVAIRDNTQEATLKKLVVEGSEQYLMAENPNWPERIIKINDSATICGVVIFKGQSFV